MVSPGRIKPRSSTPLSGAAAFAKLAVIDRVVRGAQQKAQFPRERREIHIAQDESVSQVRAQAIHDKAEHRRLCLRL
jgi:hypothetical protein